MAKKREISAGLGVKKIKDGDFDYQKMEQIIEEEYLKRNREVKYKRKKSFSPSSIGYGPSTCSRRWYLSFSGAEFDESADAVGIANMENGSAFHDRIQKLFTDAGIMAEEEKELVVEDPPIRGFIDAIAEIDGVRAVGEFKSTRDESFVHRRYSGNPMAYHLYQVLIYMYFEKIDQGFLFYENKNDQTFLTIPIRMNDYTRKIIEDAIEWMRKVHGNWKKDVIDEDEDGNPVVSYENLPTRPWTRRNKNCQQCPVFNECWENRPDGEVDLPPMEVVTL